VSDEIALAAEKAAKNAKRAMVLTMLAVTVAVIVLVIDNGIKKGVLAEAQKARQTLREFEDLAREVRSDGAKAAGETGSSGHTGDNDGSGVVHDPGKGPANGQAPGPAPAAPAKRQTRAARGTQGNG
jgi:uncharacterized protein YfcZ (UPF0381/DUF406 family)